MNKDDKLSYIYDKIWDLRKDAENKINILTVVLGIVFSSLFLFLETIIKIDKWSPNFWIVMALLCLAMLFDVLAFVFVFISIYPRSNVELKENQLLKLNDFENEYNYLYWIKQSNMNKKSLEYQINRIAIITFNKFCNAKKIIIFLLFSVFFELLMMICIFTIF